MKAIGEMRQNFRKNSCWWGIIIVGLLGIAVFRSWRDELLVQYLYLLPSVMIAIACITFAEYRFMATGVTFVAAAVGNLVSPKILTNPPLPTSLTNWGLISSQLWHGLPITISTFFGAVVALFVSHVFAKRRRERQSRRKSRNRACGEDS